MIKEHHSEIVQLRNQGLSCAKIIAKLNLNCTKQGLLNYLSTSKIQKNVIKNDNASVIKKRHKIKTNSLPESIPVTNFYGHKNFTLSKIAENYNLRKSNLSMTCYGLRNVKREIETLERCWEMSIERIREIFRNERGLVV